MEPGPVKIRIIKLYKLRPGNRKRLEVKVKSQFYLVFNDWEAENLFIPCFINEVHIAIGQGLVDCRHA